MRHKFSPHYLRAQERPATLILTVTSGLPITRARHVYNWEAEIFVLQLRTIRMGKICQSQQFVTWDAGLCGIKVRFADITTTVCHMGRKRSKEVFADVVEGSFEDD